MKVAMLLLYCGEGFQGMQRNPGARTIEGALEEALFRAGAIAECGSAKLLGWRRAARTDKGVSAAAQLVSGHISTSENVHSLSDLLNSHLPTSIRVLGCKQVPDGFCAKTLCDSRRYHFYLPKFAFDPSQHLGRRSAVVDVNGNTYNGDSNGDGKGDTFQVDLERLNRMLTTFVGCHNFHNFSWHVDASDPTAERTLLSFEAEEDATMVGFVRFVVVGKSFLLHQIRKMVGLVVSIMRGAAPTSLVETALRSDVDVVLPTAPQIGLLLDDCMYDEYNAALPRGHEHGMWWFQEQRLQIEELKRKIILPHIVQLSATAAAAWLPSLNSRNYAAFLLRP